MDEDPRVQILIAQSLILLSGLLLFIFCLESLKLLGVMGLK